MRVPPDGRPRGDLAVLEVELAYADGSVYQGVSIMEVREGKVVQGDRLLRPAVRGAAVARPVGPADAAVSDAGPLARADIRHDAASQKRWTMVAVVLGSAVVFLDTSVVNLALPRIGEDLPSDLFGTLEAQSYVAYGYFVTLSALLILAGGLTDYHGRRKMFSLGLIGFAATSLLCGIAPSMEFLIVARVLQGAAGALVVPGSLVDHHRELRGRGTRPRVRRLGGRLGGHHDPRAVRRRAARQHDLLAHGVPGQPAVARVAYFATIRYVPESRDPDASGHFDWLGSVVIVLAVGGLAFGTIRGQQQGWGEPVAVGSLVVGAHRRDRVPVPDAAPPRPARAAAAVPVAELHRDEPLDARDLRRALRLADVPRHLPDRHARLQRAGRRASRASPARCCSCSSRHGSDARGHGTVRGCSWPLGPAIMALGLLWFVRHARRQRGVGPRRRGRVVDPAARRLLHRPASRRCVVFGIGLMMMVAPLTTALMTSVPESNAGVASAINNAISRVGSPLVTAVIFVAVASSFYASIARAGARRRRRFERVPGRRRAAEPTAADVADRGPRRGPDRPRPTRSISR